MIHDITNECSRCDGTGVMRVKAAKARAVIAACSCPAGRAVAQSTAAYSVVQAVGVIGKAFR